MQEYIIAFNGTWFHFFNKPNVGLCSRRKNGLKFDDYKVVVARASADFSVYTSRGLIHIVCQDDKGSVLYLFYDGLKWERNIILESKSAKPYPKNFVITEISGHINLLYTIENKDKLMLVHQVLIGNRPPEIIAYITRDSVPFCVFQHHETDFSLFYKDENGNNSKRIFRWSEKKFLPPEKIEENISIKFATEVSDKMLVAATKQADKNNNLIFMKYDDTSLCEQSVVYERCSKGINPIISCYGEKIYMVWTEYGNVISSYYSGNGEWSRPMQYAKSSKSETKLFAVCRDGVYEYFYGIAREHDITLYGTHDILKKPPISDKHVPQFSNDFNSKNEAETFILKQERQIKILCQELSEQRKKLSDLSSKIEELLSAVPIADEDDIDNVLLN